MKIFNNTPTVHICFRDYSLNSDKNQDLELESKKSEILKLTQDIIVLGADVRKNEAEIKEKMRLIISVVGFVISYPDANPETQKNPLTSLAVNVFELIDKCPERTSTIMTYIKLFGEFANNLADAVVKRKEAER